MASNQSLCQRSRRNNKKLIHRNMAPNIPNIMGMWASDAETKSKLEIAPMMDAAPIPKQIIPRAIFSAEPIIHGPRDRNYSPLRNSSRYRIFRCVNGQADRAYKASWPCNH